MKPNRILKKSAAVLLILLLLTQAVTPTAFALTGEVSNTVVFVRFRSDAGHNTFSGGNWAEIKRMYNDTTEVTALGTEPDYSFAKYINTISRGKLSVNNYFPQESADGTYAEPLTLSFDYNPAVDPREAMISEIIAAVNSGVIPTDFSSHKPDFMETGVMDNLTIIVQYNDPNVSSERGHPLYPHKGNYPGYGNAMRGYTVSAYNMINSGTLVNYDESDTTGFPMGCQGTVSHEFLHTLGLPDLYRYYDAGDPVGGWSVMASPQHKKMPYPLSVSRERLGWININEITPDSVGEGHFTLNAVTSPTGDVAYKIRTPMSESEYFVVEYRKAMPSESPYRYGFETLLPLGSYDYNTGKPLVIAEMNAGLLIYRVNEAVDPASNADGENYIYVFRPDAIDPENALVSVAEAAVEPDKGETSYGSTDLSAAFTENTIYYSGGRNSGIALQNVALSEDGQTISFDVEFADYGSLDMWEDAGAMPLQGGVTETAVAADESGNVYAAYISNVSATGKSLSVQKFDGSVWSRVGSAFGGDRVHSADIEVFNGTPYVLCGSDDNLYLYKYSSGTWESASLGKFMNSPRLFKDGGVLYVSYLDNSYPAKLVIKDAVSGAVVNSSIAGAMLANPAAASANGTLYALYSDFGASDGNSVVKRLESDGSWSLQKRLSDDYTNRHALAVNGDDVYALSVGQLGDAAYYSEFVGGAWSDTVGVPELVGARDVALIHDGERLYVSACLYGSGDYGTAVVYEKTDSGWQKLGSDVITSSRNVSACLGGASVYVSAANGSAKNLYVKTRRIESGTSDDYTVSVIPPEGYGDTTLWIDGTPHEGTGNGEALTAELQNGAAKTVTMYKYNDSGVPVGMYVWRLSFNKRYTAEPVPELEDILSYHGFSIRYTGKTGIRIKSGVSADTRSALTSANGFAGYRLKEYGTIATTENNTASFPDVWSNALYTAGYGKAGVGKAYWTENGGVKDMVYETVGGRYRFTSVLIDIAPANYNLVYAFRAYMKLERNGVETTVYGPVLTRSLSGVSRQVLASGQFPEGSAGYEFISDIITRSESAA